MAGLRRGDAGRDDEQGSATFAAFDTGVATTRTRKATFTLDARPPPPPAISADPCGTQGSNWVHTPLPLSRLVEPIVFLSSSVCARFLRALPHRFCTGAEQAASGRVALGRRSSRGSPKVFFRALPVGETRPEGGERLPLAPSILIF